MRLLLTLFLLQLNFFILSAQVYHYKTGEIIPGNVSGIYNSKNGVFENYPAEYAVLLTPENHFDKYSRLINIPVVRIKAQNNSNKKTPIFLLNGGPGKSNLQKQLLIEGLSLNHDIVILGYRGVDGQVILNCDSLLNPSKQNKLTKQKDTISYYKTVDNCICKLKKQKIDTEGYSIQQVVADIELVREKFEYPKISFLAFSFGTIIAQEYFNKYAQNTDKQLYIAPRPQNNLYIDAEILNNQIFEFYKKYVKEIPNINSKKEVLNRMQKILLHFKNEEKIDFDMFLLFVFSQFYTINNIPNFFLALKNNNYENFNILCNNFLEKQYKNIVWGDMYLKKQNRVGVQKNNTDTNTPGFLISKTVNNIYNLNLKLVDKQTDCINLSKINDNNLFLILGESDVASPPQLWKQTLPKLKTNWRILSKTGHFDYFLEQKTLVDSLVIDFF